MKREHAASASTGPSSDPRQVCRSIPSLPEESGLSQPATPQRMPITISKVRRLIASVFRIARGVIQLVPRKKGDELVPRGREGILRRLDGTIRRQLRCRILRLRCRQGRSFPKKRTLGFLERKAFFRPIETRRVSHRMTSVSAIGPLNDLRARLIQKLLSERQPFDGFRLSNFTANIQTWLSAGYAGRSRARLRIHKQRARNERNSAVAANMSCRMKHLGTPRPASKF